MPGRVVLPAVQRTKERSMGIMGFIGTLVVGLIVGAIARWVLPGAQSMGWIMTALLGIGGSIVGGFFSSLIWKSPDGKFHPAGWIMSILGAVVLLWLVVNFGR
jgi:uncharacterized membrane protein YeaQ/YmgE (transglycosylase-associated protein family)